MLKLAEYLWLDGTEPTASVRSKARVVDLPEERDVTPDCFPRWSFDGSSTGQADGGNSDLLLEPVHVVRDPLRGNGNYLVLCEVDDPDGKPHASNQRARLRAALEEAGTELDPWLGFEQEYTMVRNGRPLGFRKTDFLHRRDPTTAVPVPRTSTGARSSRNMRGPASRPAY